MQRVRFVALITGATLLAGSVAAVADNLEADGDAVSPSGTAVDFGTVCVGAQASRTLTLRIKRTGNYPSTNVFLKGGEVELSGTAPSGVSLTTGSLTLPSDWNGLANNALSSPGTLTATLDTTLPRVVSGTISVTADGPGSDGTPVARTDSLGVSATVQACSSNDSVAPGSVNVVVNDGAAWTNSTTVSLDLGASDNVGITRYRLAESEGALGTASDVAVSPATTTLALADIPFGLTGADATAKEVWLRVYDAAGNWAVAHDTIGLDRVAPTIVGFRDPAAGNLVNDVQYGWNNTDVTVTFVCDDDRSGVDSCTADVVLDGNGAGQSVPGMVTDHAGNTASTSVDQVNIDKDAPLVALVGGPAEASYYPHQLLGVSAPTCTASDQVGLSGVLGSCEVTGATGFPAVGSYSFGASARDHAGNEGSATPRSVQVIGYRTSGFYSPVDLNGTLNTVKSGSTVPLKFEVFAGDVEMTDTAIVTGLKPVLTTCGGAAVDDVEQLATGGTSLRYDPSGIGQFIYNWQTPKGRAGYCYRVTVHLVGGQTIAADFKLK